MKRVLLAIALLAAVTFIVVSPKRKSEFLPDVTSGARRAATNSALQLTAPLGTPKSGAPSSGHAVHEVTFSLEVDGNGLKPILRLTLNLPPKTAVIAYLANPVNQGGNGYSGEQKASVGPDQIADFGPFSKSGGALSSGSYLVTIGTPMVDLQPREVQAYFGANGQNLSGSSVISLAGEKTVSRKFSFMIDESGLSSGVSP